MMVMKVFMGAMKVFISFSFFLLNVKKYSLLTSILVKIMDIESKLHTKMQLSIIIT